MNAPIPSRQTSRLLRDTLAIVMAGGRGARLMQLTATRAKPAVPFGGIFRIIDFTLSNCINSGLRRIGVLTQYKSTSLIRHLQHGWGFLRGHFGEFLELLPAEQRVESASWYAGTADAVYQNLEFIRQHQPAQVLVLAGDHVYRMDYGRMLTEHARSGALVTVGCIEVPIEESSSFGIMTLAADGRVTSFDEKPERAEPLPDRPGSVLASMGIYVFDARFLLEHLTRDAGLHDSSHDFGRDVIPAAIAQGGVHGYRFADLDDDSQPGYWRDVGTVDTYWQANRELIGVLPELNLYDERWPILTDHPLAPPAKFIFGGAHGHDCVQESLISAGCIVSGASVHGSVMFVNSRVDAGSHVEGSLLLPGVAVGRGCRIVNAIVDEGCVIPDGVSIGGAQGDGAYHVSPGGVTLVTREMLSEAGFGRASVAVARA
jgi:glucose-1-phosphate adenylyltransferase